MARRRAASKLRPNLAAPLPYTHQFAEQLTAFTQLLNYQRAGAPAGENNQQETTHQFRTLSRHLRQRGQQSASYKPYRPSPPPRFL